MVRPRVNAPTRAPAGAVGGWLLLTIAAPAVCATLLVLLFMGMEMAGYTPSSVQPDNIAEAARIGNAAEILRRLQAGEDPTRRQTIRPDLSGGAETHMTALEAAVFSRRVQNVQLLDARGAIVDAATRHFLACLAVDLEVEDIVEYLSPGDAPRCDPGAARTQVRTR